MTVVRVRVRVRVRGRVRVRVVTVRDVKLWEMIQRRSAVRHKGPGSTLLKSRYLLLVVLPVIIGGIHSHKMVR